MNIIWFMKKALYDAYFWINGNLRIVYGMWLIRKLPKPRITIYGGRFVSHTSPYAKSAAHLSSLCAQHGISVLTGGGPGIMHAAACSTSDKSKAVGISVLGLEPLETVSLCNDQLVFMLSFPARKWLLREFSQGFVVFPGGIGTLDEFDELLMLMQLKNLERAPIVLFGSLYWKTYLQWFDEAILEGNILPEVRSYFVVTDDVEEAFNVLFTQRQKHLKNNC